MWPQKMAAWVRELATNNDLPYQICSDPALCDPRKQVEPHMGRWSHFVSRIVALPARTAVKELCRVCVRVCTARGLDVLWGIHRIPTQTTTCMAQREVKIWFMQRAIYVWPTLWSGRAVHPLPPNAVHRSRAHNGVRVRA